MAVSLSARRRHSAPAERDLRMGFKMINNRLALVLILGFCVCSVANAQSPRSAEVMYDQGRERYLKGDFDGAIAAFTRAPYPREVLAPVSQA
jgi:outer membrane protein assembly factor BamD (BamD/ComL family)